MLYLSPFLNEMICGDHAAYAGSAATDHLHFLECLTNIFIVAKGVEYHQPPSYGQPDDALLVASTELEREPIRYLCGAKIIALCLQPYKQLYATSQQEGTESGLLDRVLNQLFFSTIRLADHSSTATLLNHIFNLQDTPYPTIPQLACPTIQTLPFSCSVRHFPQVTTHRIMTEWWRFFDSHKIGYRYYDNPDVNYKNFLDRYPHLTIRDPDEIL